MLKGGGNPLLSAIPVIWKARSRQQRFLESEGLHLEPPYSPFSATVFVGNLSKTHHTFFSSQMELLLIDFF